MTTIENPVRNGVDTATLFATLDAVKGNPDIAKFQFRATNTLGQRHPQPVHDPRLLRRHAGDDPPAAVHATTPTTPPCWSAPTTARRRSSSCCTPSPPASPPAWPTSPPPAASTSPRSTSTVEGDIDLLGILGLSDEVRNGYQQIKVSFKLRGDDPEKLRKVVEQSRQRSAVYDVVTNGVPVAIEVDAG